MLTNVVREFIIRNEIDLALITETWLKESVSNTVVDIPEFTLLRRDGKSENHGGVCAYIKASRYKLSYWIIWTVVMITSVCGSIWGQIVYPEEYHV